MRLRSLLFVPGDRPERMEKALASGADALILDLEDAVAPQAKAEARQHVVSFLHRPRDRGVQLLVRINPLDSGEAEADAQALAAVRPDAIMLPKAEGRRAIERALTLFAAQGQSFPLLPIAAETAMALFTLGEYPQLARHLYGLTWGAEDLAVAAGAASSRDEHGALADPLRIARALVLFAAQAAQVPALDTVFADFRDDTALAGHAAASARDGFGGMLAIHPAQIPIINTAFTPDANEVGRARRIIQAFDANPEKGALQLDGKMIDTPHLLRARSLLERAS